jgi:protein KRI1
VTVKEKYGSDYGEDSEESVSDSESDELEDEDGEELTPAIDAAILRTLARIKRKDPEIYQSEKDIFTGAQSITSLLSFLFRTFLYRGKGQNS